jgi:hypothetical protein
MMNDANPAVVNDKNGDGEINFFVDVSHVLPENFNNKDAKARRKILVQISGCLATRIIRRKWTARKVY